MMLIFLEIFQKSIKILVRSRARHHPLTGNHRCILPSFTVRVAQCAAEISAAACRTIKNPTAERAQKSTGRISRGMKNNILMSRCVLWGASPGKSHRRHRAHRKSLSCRRACRRETQLSAFLFFFASTPSTKSEWRA
jgi:hypothetical protein